MNRNYTNFLIASVFVLLASCATLTDEQEYERADTFLQARDQFELKEIECRNAGGVMVIEITTGSFKMRNRRDYEYARCVSGGI